MICMKNWIEIISFTHPHEAHLAKNFLESSGVEVEIKDEFTVQVYGFLSNAIGGVKLFVEEDNAKEALSLLESGGYIEKKETEANTQIETFSADQKDTCPYCNSTNTSQKKIPGYLFVLSILLLSFPLPFLKRRYYCYECRKEWKIEKDK